MNNEINSRIAKYRKLACLTQAQTAEKLGMKCSTYSQMERKGNIKAQIIEQLAKIFNIDPCVLIFGEEFNTKPEPPVITEKPPIVEPLPPKNATLTQSDPVIKLPIPEVDFDTLSHKEQSFIKIYRSLSKEDKADVNAYFEAKYKKTKRKQ